MTNKQRNNIITTLRALSLDEIARAKSGHPGMALGAATIFYTLFRDHLNIDPKNPEYFNRDRFVLSAGHGSSLLYATMLCAGYKSINMEDLKKFRQLGSKTSGHPEPHLLAGVEVATGPLGQGVATAVGLAIAERKLAAEFNEYSELIDHYTYCLHGDGCFQEGVYYEAIALAGKLKLNKLILLYDSNDIQLDGKVSNASVTNVAKFFEANNWNYIKVRHGNNVGEISRAISDDKLSELPTCIELKTTIGYGTKKANSHTCHGSAFSEDEVLDIKKSWKYRYPKFSLPDDIKTYFTDPIAKRVVKNTIKFSKHLNLLEKRNISLYYKLIDAMNDNFGLLPEWYKTLKPTKEESSRATMSKVVDIATQHLNNLMVGAADVAASTKIGEGKNATFFEDVNYGGQVIRYGVRELAMACVVNGICAHKGLRAIGSTFFAFSDYCKPATRMAAIGQLPAITIYSHDSFTVGEDGPTHQPIEQLNALRLIPNHYLFRPHNLEECIYALYFGLTKKTAPTSIATSRSAFIQTPTIDYRSIAQGAYFLQYSPTYKYSLLGTGSEVATCFEVAEILEKKYNTKVNIISAPCMNLFEEQPQTYKDLILKAPIFSIEFGSTNYWYKYSKHPIGVNCFGKSAPADMLKAYFKLQPKQIALDIVQYLGLKAKSTKRKEK